MDGLDLFRQAQQHTVKQALDSVEQNRRNQIALEVSTESAEVSVQGNKGRLTGAAYVQIVYGATKDYLAGIRGVWQFRP